MPSERVQRQIDALLDEAETAIKQRDWAAVREAAEAVLRVDPENPDALSYLAMARTPASTPTQGAQSDIPTVGSGRGAPLPAAFCDSRYEVKRFLGEGGKKLVYLAHDTKLDRDIAFALIKTDGLDDEGLLRIKREAQAMGRLGDHPHIVAVYDIGEEHGQPYLVSQLMSGGDVEALIEKAENHRVPLDVALKIADQVCQALDHAHRHGVVHRDLKPGNVWLTADGTAKLGDFGLAVALDKVRLTQAGMMVGTVSYMPPEQAMGGDVTPRSDLYSLGAMLYELATGRPPFVGDESVAIITQHLNMPPVAPSWHARDLPPGLEVLILRLLEKDPQKRLASAAEARQALADVSRSPSVRSQEIRANGDGSSPDAVAAGAGGSGDNPLYRRIFVGREPELRQLQSAFDMALSGRSGLMMVIGEPGIGKTALCEQLATYIAVRGGHTLVGHCYEEGSLSLPYLAFVEALRTYVLEREPSALRQDLGTGAEDVARIVSEIRQRLGVEPSTTSGIDPDEDRWRLFQALASFLKNASAVQPLVIVLEDLHWADRGTLDLLIHLSRSLQDARLLIVGTYRDVEVDRTHPLSATLAELRRAAMFDRVLLRGLTADEVQRMLAAIAGQTISWGFAEAVHRQTEGNPLFVQEVIRYLAEEGLIQRDGGRWERAGTTPLEMSIPEGLRDVIGKRLSRLSTECNRILSIAAVVGRDFDLDTLQTVAGAEPDTVVEALEEAVRVGILEEQPRPGAIRYRYTHAFFRQTLYEELSAPRRLRLHQQVGRALEARYGSRLDEHAAELCDHFSQSTDPSDLAKAVRYGELAARRAMAVYAYGEAARLLKSTLEVQEVLNPDDQEKRCDLLLALGETLGPAGDPRQAAEEVGPAAFALAEALNDRTRAAQVCEMALDAIHRQIGPRAVTTEPYYGWAQRLDKHASPGTRARAYADCVMGSVLRPRGLMVEANEHVLRALEQARQLADPEVLFRTVASALFPGWPLEFQEEQYRLAHEFTEHPRQGVRTSTLVLLLQRAQTFLLAAGDRERAEVAWKELDELATHTRDVVPLLWPIQRDAIRAHLDGELEEAVSACQRLVQRASELGIPVAGRDSATWLSYQPLSHLGRPEDVPFALIPRMVARGVNNRADYEAIDAILTAKRGERQESIEKLHAAIKEQQRQAASRPVPAVYPAAIVEAAVLLGDVEGATYARDSLAGATAIVAFDLIISNVARHLGGASALLGDRAAALSDYRRALDWATRIRHRPEVALTRLEIAELLLDGTPDERAEAQLHLDFAIDEFRAMKMQPSLERALRHKGLLHA